MATKRSAAPAPSKKQRQFPGLATALGFAVAAVALYSGTLSYGFVWDDPISVQRWLPALPTWWSAFFPPANIPQFPADYYRPLQLLSYRLDRAVGGGAPWAFHLDVVLLHALATVLVFRTGARFLGPSPSSAWAAAAAAALFAAHPIHTESVAWMAARPDVMVTCAGLGALLAYWHPGWSAWLRASTASGLVLVALLCKENAAALLLMIPASTLILPLSNEREARRRPTFNRAELLPFAAAAVVYLILRTAGAGSGAIPATALPANPVAALIGATGSYLRLLVLPYPQSAYVTDLWDTGPALLVSLLIVAAFAAITFHSWRRDDRPLLFALLWIVVTLAPSLAATAKAAIAPLAERYLYLPSVGFCWAAGLLAVRAGTHRQFGRIAQAGAVIVLIAAAAATMSRNRVWNDNVTLWSDTAQKNPTSGLPLRSLAAVTLERGDSAAAEGMFRDALARSNDAHGLYVIHNNLGTIALNRGDETAAEGYYRRALSFESAPDCIYNLGLIELRRALNPELAAEARAQKQQAARELFEQALASSPYDADIHIALAQAAEAMADKRTARRHFEEALRLGVPPTTAAAVRRRLKEVSTP